MKTKSFRLVFLLPILFAFTSCGEGKTEFVFKLWNDCEAITTLKEYVKDVTDKNSKNFIPEADRIATFDMDGTIYGELFPTYLEYNMLQYRGLEDPTYDAPEDVVEAATAIKEFVENGTKLPSGFELIHARAAAKAYSGMTLKEFDKYVKDYLKTPVWGFNNMTYAEAFYQPMLEIFDYLKENKFDYYVVSGSDRFICRSLICDTIGVDPSKIIGMDVELAAKNQGDTDPLQYVYSVDDDEVIRTENLIIKNLKMNKVKQIATDIGKQPVLSFGNSSGDCSMHNYAMSNPKYRSNAFMLIADDFERDYGTPERLGNLEQEWKNDGYTVISMKNNFKTIYPTKASRK